MKPPSPSFRILRHVVLMAVALVFLMPFIWMVLTSLKPADEIFGSEIHLFPTRFAAVENYTLALTKVPLLRYLWNGVLVCAGILVLQILVALPAAYAFAKLSLKLRLIVTTAVLVVLSVAVVSAFNFFTVRSSAMVTLTQSTQALADQEAADQDGVLGFAGALDDRSPCHRADHGFTGGQRLGRHQGDFALRVGVGQALGGFRRQLGHRLQEAVADLFGPEQAEGRMQRRPVFGADRADQQLVATGCLENLVPGRHAVTGSHTGDS